MAHHEESAVEINFNPLAAIIADEALRSFSIHHSEADTDSDHCKRPK